MAANKTYRDMQDNVLALLSKSDATTRNRIKNWLNMGYYDFVLREQWPFRESTDDITTSSGTQEYPLALEISDIDNQNIVSVASQGSSPISLTYKSFEQLRKTHPDFSQGGQSTPEYYYVKGGSIGFYPVPDGAYTVAVDYYKVPDEMDDDTDEPIIPIGYRESLVQYALSMEHDYDDDPDLAVKAMNAYEVIVTKARNNLLVQVTDSGNFRISGPADFVNWTSIG